MIRCVVFDFDGTLRQSVAIKHEAYFAAVRDIERGDELFREIIREFPTMTRYSGCALFAERARALGIDCPDGEELAERYTRACEDAIAACPEVPGSTAFLDWLQARPVYCFVVSGTPQTPLRETVKRIELEDRFVDVLAIPSPSLSIILTFSLVLNCRRQRCLRWVTAMMIKQPRKRSEAGSFV